LRRGCDLASTRCLLEPFRQLCEIDRHLSSLVERQEVGLSSGVGLGQSIKHGELLPAGVVHGESLRDLNDPPRTRKAAGYAGGPSGIFFDRRWLAGVGLLLEVSQPRIILRHEQIAVFDLA
jgi:hypothetical protein